MEMLDVEPAPIPEVGQTTLVMEPMEFVYWLQGFVTLSGGNAPNPDQWQTIERHLKKVFEQGMCSGPSPRRRY